jgi:hypothetical protein
MPDSLQVPIQYIETMLPACYGGRDLTTSDRFQPGFRNASHWLNYEAAIVIIAFPPDEPAAAKAIAAAPWLPRWQASFVPLDAAARKTSATSDTDQAR